MKNSSFWENSKNKFWGSGLGGGGGQVALGGGLGGGSGWM